MKYSITCKATLTFEVDAIDAEEADEKGVSLATQYTNEQDVDWDIEVHENNS